MALHEYFNAMVQVLKTNNIKKYNMGELASETIRIKALYSSFLLLLIWPQVCICTLIKIIQK